MKWIEIYTRRLQQLEATPEEIKTLIEVPGCVDQQWDPIVTAFQDLCRLRQEQE